MLLYFKPGACSLASRIVLIELDLPFVAMAVDTQAGTTKAGADYRRINPKGYVPALEVAPGVIVTENPAVLQYLADHVPEAGLAPAAGTLDRVRLQEWLNFISAELHKAFGPYFHGDVLQGPEKARVEATLLRRIDDVEAGLSDGRSFLLGTVFSVADAYLFVVLNWASFIGVDLARWPCISAFMTRMLARPAVRKALAAEGLLQDEAA
ncbi:glutathione binding-like protein [Shinella sp.]|uniref:glutathione binding-like protein n=1 Tax=Shinella sp. TaxID=1870904 RepID=UPI004035D778